MKKETEETKEKIFKDGPPTDPANAIEGTIFADTPKIIVIGTSEKEITDAVAQIRALYNNAEQMPVILVDHKHRPICESSIAEIENYKFKEVLPEFIKTVTVEHMKQYEPEKYNMMKIRRCANMRSATTFEDKKKKKRMQKHSRKQNRRRK